MGVCHADNEKKTKKTDDTHDILINNNCLFGSTDSFTEGVFFVILNQLLFCFQYRTI